MNPQDEIPSAAEPAAEAPAIAAAPVAASAEAAPAPVSAWDQAIARFARDYLADRRTERRWRVFFRLLWLTLFAAAFWAVINARLPPGSTISPMGLSVCVS